MAFKEWAVIVDALGRGEQVIILRKGGISEGRVGFRPEHSHFLLFPTKFHQQRESVLPEARPRFDQSSTNLPDPSKLHLEFSAEVVTVQRLDSPAAAQRLRGQHLWRDDVIAQRFDWGKDKGIHALAVRVFRLPKLIELPMSPGYGGCKSWVKLDLDVPTAGARPVLSDKAFAEKLNRFRGAVETSGTA